MARRPFDLHWVLACVLSAGLLLWAPAGSAERVVVLPVDHGFEGQTATTAGDRVQEVPPETKRKDQHVTGKVLDRDGKAVATAEVRFEGPKKERVFTDSRGEFSFTGPAGDYVITVKAGGRKQNFKVKIEDNQLTPSTLVIEPQI